jgi:hypothetical protein
VPLRLITVYRVVPHTKRSGWAVNWSPALHLDMSYNHSPGLQRQMYLSNPSSIHIIHSSSVCPVAKAPLACPLPQPLLPQPRLERVSSLHFSSSRQNACLAHSPFLGTPVLAWVESPSRSLVGDALGRALSSCAESPAS